MLRKNWRIDFECEGASLVRQSAPLWARLPRLREHLHGGSKSICRRIRIYFAIAFVPDLCCEFFASLVTREEAFSVFRKGTAIHQIATSFNTILVFWCNEAKVEFDNFIVSVIDNLACFTDSFDVVGNACKGYCHHFFDFFGQRCVLWQTPNNLHAKETKVFFCSSLVLVMLFNHFVDLLINKINYTLVIRKKSCWRIVSSSFLGVIYNLSLSLIIVYFSFFFALRFLHFGKYRFLLDREVGSSFFVQFFDCLL